MLKKILLYPIAGHFALIWLIGLVFTEMMFQMYLNHSCMVCTYGDNPILIRLFFFITFFCVANIAKYFSQERTSS